MSESQQKAEKEAVIAIANRRGTRVRELESALEEAIDALEEEAFVGDLRKVLQDKIPTTPMANKRMDEKADQFLTDTFPSPVSKEVLGAFLGQIVEEETESLVETLRQIQARARATKDTNRQMYRVFSIVDAALAKTKKYAPLEGGQ